MPPKAERVLRLSGLYHRKDGVSEEEFQQFSRQHAIDCAKIHQKYGTLKYQIVRSHYCFNVDVAVSNEGHRRAVLVVPGRWQTSMKTPYKVNDHDLKIECYFKDVANLLAVSADEEFKKLHIDSEPYVRHDTATVTLTWIETYLEDGKIVNTDPEEKSTYASFVELSDIKVTDKPVAKYYEE
ncbi:hypothetical protein F4810DRAFT_705431 [Camillea tinctor]|nr:hypothetical protein F4810DRAFT_705431 [Camillea tinctor]